MEQIIKREKYDILFANNGEIIILLESIKGMEFEKEAILNMKIRTENGLIVKIIKDSKNTLVLEDFPMEASVAIEDKEDIIITQLGDDGDILENYLARITIGD